MENDIMENDIKIVMTKQWTDVMVAYYLEASKRFQPMDPSTVSIADLAFWTEGWLGANIEFTKMEMEHAA